MSQDVINAAIDANVLWLAKVVRRLAGINSALDDGWGDMAACIAELTAEEAASLNAEFRSWTVRHAIVEVDDERLGREWELLKGRCMFALGKFQAHPTIQANISRSLGVMAARVPKDTHYKAAAANEVAWTAVWALQGDAAEAMMAMLQIRTIVAHGQALDRMRAIDRRYAETEFAQEDAARQAYAARGEAAFKTMRALVNMIAATAAPEAKCA